MELSILRILLSKFRKRRVFSISMDSPISSQSLMSLTRAENAVTNEPMPPFQQIIFGAGRLSIKAKADGRQNVRISDKRD